MTVYATVVIINNTKKFNFVTKDKGFTWGRMQDETEELKDIGPGSETRVGVQGRQDSPSGVTGWFKYVVRGTEKIGEFKVNFDCPWAPADTNKGHVDTTNYGDVYIINNTVDIEKNTFTYTVGNENNTEHIQGYLELNQNVKKSHFESHFHAGERFGTQTQAIDVYKRGAYFDKFDTHIRGPYTSGNKKFDGCKNDIYS
nr:10387_t:CDS:2 [Entrophospora candida]